MHCAAHEMPSKIGLTCTRSRGRQPGGQGRKSPVGRHRAEGAVVRWGGTQRLAASRAAAANHWFCWQLQRGLQLACTVRLSQIEAKLTQAALQPHMSHTLAHKVVEVGCPLGLGLREGERQHRLPCVGRRLGSCAGQHSTACWPACSLGGRCFCGLPLLSSSLITTLPSCPPLPCCPAHS